MRHRFLLLWVILLSSCVPSAPALQPRTVTVRVTSPQGPVVGAAVVLDASDPTGVHNGATAADGSLTLQLVPPLWTNAQLTVTAVGCDRYSQSVILPLAAPTALTVLLSCAPPPPAHVDPSLVPFEQLAAIRGAMWPRAEIPGMPYGPHPDDPLNIIATGSWNCYTPDQRTQAAAELHRRGYTHVVAGPIGVPGQDSYHGQFCAPDADWETFLDDLQDLWDRGFIPIVFVHPDNWTFAQTHDYFDSLLRSDRAQRLIRVVVITGWEPAGYNWSSCTWAQYYAWAHEALPNALSLMHNAVKPDGSPYDGPVGTDSLCDDNGKPNGDGWQRVFAAGLDGWLIQTGPDTTAPTQAPAQHVAEWCAVYKSDGDGATYHSIAWHFTNGISGFPTTTLRGQHFRLYAGEVTAFAKYWGSLPEADAEAWGDLAMSCGADGYLDSGTVPVTARVP